MRRWAIAALAGAAAALAAAGVADADVPRVAAVENRGLLFTDNDAGISGMDAGYSLPIGDRTLWLFGDAFLLARRDPARPYVGGVSNGGLLVARGRGAAPLRRYAILADPATGLARPVLPYLPGEDQTTRVWPMGGWYDAAARRAYLYYAVVRTSGSGPLDFRLKGHGLAAANARAPERLAFERLPGPGGAALWWGPGGRVFGAAVAHRAGDRWLYVAGVSTGPGPNRAAMARVTAERIADPNAYEYFAGAPESPRWTRDPSEAADVAGLGDLSEASITWNDYLGGWLAVHSVGISEKAVLCLASRPWGPYRAIATIGTPHQAFAKAFCYAAKEHPELAEEGGRVVYITYVDSGRYWLHLLRVTLAR
ncbi:MAG: DUF4185 domain-containing protein [Chthonomonadales bacterium]|nr:DUF4185 domain-containing protein [Chthonomonadales bacterium]